MVDKVAYMATDMVAMYWSYILGTVDVDVFFAHISKVQIQWENDCSENSGWP